MHICAHMQPMAVHASFHADAVREDAAAADDAIGAACKVTVLSRHQVRLPSCFPVVSLHLAAA